MGSHNLSLNQGGLVCCLHISTPTNSVRRQHITRQEPLLKEIQTCSSVFDKMPSIKLQSKDGEVFQIDTDAAKLSVTIRDMMELLGIEEGSEDPVPLGEVNAQTLNRVIQWCTHHKNDPVPTEGMKARKRELKTDDIPSWDQEFLELDQELLFELIRAANYLHVK